MGELSCPVCSFPLIDGTISGLHVIDVLHRESVSVGGPPLPGVDTEPREAELLAKARRERHERGLARGTLSPGVAKPMPSSLPSSPPSSRGVGVVCSIGLGLGVLATVWAFT